PLEIALGAALVCGFRTRVAAFLTGVLLLVFMGATAYAWSQGRTEGCGCFGSLASRTPGQVLGEDAGFLALPWLACILKGGERAAGFGRLAALPALVLAGGVALPLWAYDLPIDSWVTDLRIGRSLRQLPLENSPLDLSRGNQLIALLDLDAPEAREIVKRLNEIKGRAGGPGVMAFYGGGGGEENGFFFYSKTSV